MRLMKKYSDEIKIKLLAYCLMPNHYHFLVHQEGEQTAGLFPQKVFNAYAKAFNAQYTLKGTMFESPYKVKLVDKDEYLVHLCRYIHVNPVKANLVKSPEDWEFSGYRSWTESKASHLSDQSFIQDLFPNPHEYHNFVNDYLLGFDVEPEGFSHYLFD